MSLDVIAPALLRDVRIEASFGSRIALNRLPPDTAYPALVWMIIDETDDDYLDAQGQPPVVRGILQLNPLAKTYGEVRQLHKLLRSVLDEKTGIEVDGHHVIRIARSSLGPPDRDEDAGVWTRAADYLIQFDAKAPTD